MDLKLDWYRRNGYVVIDHMGDLDVYTMRRLWELSRYLVSIGESRHILNLEALEFLDSAGLGAIVGALKRLRAEGGSLYIVCTQQRILLPFRATGLIKAFPIFDTVDEAVASLAQMMKGLLSSGGLWEPHHD
jgi:anti-sigma B factor antagonist